ncbi:hypothetical protein OU994_12795 [Pseudoduganella sp. SL102]|uniref:hypothetical protein n=1 Tax=Pseudoduganella sp. SL102 TaxID=2995154 RepID=UPI00248B479C|nr:hypothetical protein [Pseudoduganella sp. SL102]WBS05087.1 hypothetical protein OU994_12795 [Pseudoduganella sp. SL102]
MGTTLPDTGKSRESRDSRLFSLARSAAGRLSASAHDTHPSLAAQNTLFDDSRRHYVGEIRTSRRKIKLYKKTNIFIAEFVMHRYYSSAQQSIAVH